MPKNIANQNINCGNGHYNGDANDYTVKYKPLISNEEFKPQLYKKRFFVMFLYCLCTMLNGFQWIQFAIIGSVLSCYYNVSVELINWTSIIFMAMNIPFMFPVMWLMKNKGLKVVLIIASAGNALSSCVQCFSLSPDKFYIALISQTMASIAQVFSLPVPPFIAAVWFGANEVSTACAVGVFSNLLGSALGFIVSPLLMPSDCTDKTDVHYGLMLLALGQTVINTVVFMAITFFLKAKPPTPPSIAEAVKHPDDKVSLVTSMGILLKDLNFASFIITYGLLNAVYAAVGTMLNQMIVIIFPNKVLDAGKIGLISSFLGMGGTLFGGFLLDRTHKFRLVNLSIYFLSLAGVVVYTVIAHIKILWLHYLMLSLMGFVMVSYMAAGYEFGIEISYPVPEEISGSILCCSYQFFGIITTVVGTWLQQSYGVFPSNLFLSIVVLIGFLMTIFIKCDMKRTNQTLADVEEKALLPTA